MHPIPRDELCQRLLLNGLSQIGPVTVRRLQSAFEGQLRKVLEADATSLQKIKGVSSRAIASLLSRDFDWQKEFQRIHQLNYRLLIPTAPPWPPALECLWDPPLILYGEGHDFPTERAIAIIGTRHCTPYGAHLAKKMACELASRGWWIISGLARGIDTWAHEGALEAQGKTAAILGHGLDLTYPPEALKLRRRIMTHGCLLSEFPLGRVADRQTFPQRNRLVAALARAVVVIETDQAGGSMITARFASELGKTVCAVPGRVDSTASRGCHALLRDGATLVTKAEDVLQELGESPQPLLFPTATPQPPHRPDDLRWLKHFAGGTPHDAETLATSMSCSTMEAATMLTLLEIRGQLIRRPDGKHEAV